MGPFTGVVTASRARSTSRRRHALSSGGLSDGSPVGYGIPLVGTIRGAPTRRAIEVRLHRSAVGMPARSSSFASVAPQRVPVPHVEVSTAALTSEWCRSAAHSMPKRRALPTDVPLPAVTR